VRAYLAPFACTSVRAPHMRVRMGMYICVRPSIRVIVRSITAQLFHPHPLKGRDRLARGVEQAAGRGGGVVDGGGRGGVRGRLREGLGQALPRGALGMLFVFWMMRAARHGDMVWYGDAG